MLYIYCPVPSSSAYELVQALEGTRLRKFDGLDFWKRGKRVKLEAGDILLCWGKPIPELEGIRVLNGGESSTVLLDVSAMSNGGLLSVPKRKGLYPGYEIHKTFKGKGELLLPRRVSNPDYSVMKLNFVSEYRIHSFDGRSIRAGEKALREGYNIVSAAAFFEAMETGNKEKYAHPWVRTWESGWRMNYDFKSNQKLRKLASSALKALGLTFGAVEIGLRYDDERYYVLGVNRAPFLDSGTIATYTKAIQRWIREEKPEPEEEDVPVVPEAPGIQPLEPNNMVWGDIVQQFQNLAAPEVDPPVVRARARNRMVVQPRAPIPPYMAPRWRVQVGPDFLPAIVENEPVPDPTPVEYALQPDYDFQPIIEMLDEGDDE